MVASHGAPRPSVGVLRAFGLTSGAAPERLDGGRGTTWRVDDVVLRPHGDPREARWRSDVLAHLVHTAAFRTPRPVAASDGAWLVDGWEAWEWLAGTTDPTRVAEVIAAGSAFHRALVGVPRPGFLDDVGGPWAEADRMVWHGGLPADPTLDRLAAAFRPVETPAQLIHGDLLGNVLFAAGQPPAVFDWASYWRPPGLGAAIAAVDAVCWHDVPLELLGALGDGVPEWSQLLVRALAFRVATLVVLGAWDRAAVDHHRPVVDALVQGAAGTLVVS